MRLDNAVTLFLSEWPSEGAARSTVRTYGDNLEWFCTFAAARRAVHLDDLTPSLLRAAALARMDLQANAHAPNFKGGEAAACLVVAATKRLARWLLAQGVPVADLSTVRSPRVPERIQPRLYQNEFDALQTAVLRRLISGTRRVPRVAVARDLALLHTLGETGLRANEICGMQLSHVDLQRGELLVANAKGNKQRVLSIVGTPDDDDPLRVVRLIAEWLETRATLRRAQAHNAVWTSMKGNPIRPEELRHILARMCLEAGLASSRPPHSFRRYVFTEHYRNRPNALPRLSARMGWSDKSHKMVGVYTRGVELELAREPMPLLGGGRMVRPLKPALLAVNGSGVDPPGGKLNDRAALPLHQKRADTAASFHRRSGSAPQL